MQSEMQAMQVAIKALQGKPCSEPTSALLSTGVPREWSDGGQQSTYAVHPDEAHTSRSSIAPTERDAIEVQSDLEVPMGAIVADMIYRDEESRLLQEGISGLSQRPGVDYGASRAGVQTSNASSGVRGQSIPNLTPRSDHRQRFKDPVAVGLCSEQEGKRLFDM